MKKLLGLLGLFVAVSCWGQTSYRIYNNTLVTNSYRIVRTPDIVNSPGVQTSVNTHTGILPGAYVDGSTGSSANNQTVRCKYSSGPNIFMTPIDGYFQVGSGNPALMVFTDGIAETNCLFQWPILNNTTAIQTYYAVRSLVIQMDKTLTLSPGGVGTLQFNAPCAESNLWTVLWAPFGEPVDLDIDGQITPVDEEPDALTPTVVEDPAPVSYNPTNNVGTNSPIKWEVSTNDSQTGYNALYEAITKGNAKQDLNMQTLISNTVIMTAGTGETGIVAAIESFHRDATNSAGYEAHLGSITNHIGNLESTVATANEDVESMFGPLAQSEFAFDEGTVEASFWQVQLVQGKAETTMDFNILTWLAPVANVMKTILRWVLLVAVAFIVIKDITLAVKSLHQTTQMTLPNFQATFLGVGGNWGATLTPLYVAAWLGIWAGLILTIAGLSGDIFTTEILSFLRAGPMGSAASGNSAVAQGIAIASAFVPWAAIVSMTFALIVWKSSLNIAINLARVFAKLMVGG